MKLKEVCAETGLSRKTIRLYEEKGLLVPQMERRNGRDYREYTPEDIRKLKNIAMLRRAWFTMDEIKQMLDDPEAIQEIFPQYRQWLRQQKKDLDELLAVAEHVDTMDVGSIEALTEAMSTAASKLPLPVYDVKPRFKYLDEMEERPKASALADPLDRIMTGDKTRTQAAVSVSNDKKDDMLVTVSVMNETYDMLQRHESRPVADRPPQRDPWYLRFLTGLLTILAIISAVFFIHGFISFSLSKEVVIPFVLFFGARMLLLYREHLKEQKRWLARIGEVREPSKIHGLSKRSKRVIFLVILAVLLVSAVAIVLSAYVRWMKNNTEADYAVAVVSNERLDPAVLDRVAYVIEYIVDDCNNDGVVKIVVDECTVDSFDPDVYQLALLIGKTVEMENFSDGTDSLPEEMRDSIYPYCMNLGNAPFLEPVKLKMPSTAVYGYVPPQNTKSMAAITVEVLKILKEREHYLYY